MKHWEVKAKHKNKFDVAKMTMLCGMKGNTRKRRIRTASIGEELEVASIIEKMVECQLRWLGYVTYE